MINKNLTGFYPDFLKEIIAKIDGAGYEAYVVGGCLRDVLLGRPPKDYDVATSALPGEIIDLFGISGDFKTVETGLKYGTVTVISRGNPVEITTFRLDGSYFDLRRPDNVSFTQNITEDLSRRDFTINAMAYSVQTGLIDPFDGKNDLESGKIRAVGNPEKRFTEDALRILRAFRFVSQLGFDIELSTLGGAFTCRAGLEKIARERVGAEFQKLVVGRSPRRALDLLIEYDIMPHIFGDFLLDSLVINAIELIINDFPLRIGTLLYGADRETAARILRGLKYSRKIIGGSLSVAEGLKYLAEIPVNTDKDARIFIKKYQEAAKNIAEAAQTLGFIETDTTEIISRNAYCGWRLSDLAVTGNDLALIGFSGAEIGETLEKLLAAVIENPAANNRNALLEMAGEMSAK